MKSAKSHYSSGAIFFALMLAAIVFAVAMIGRFDVRWDLTEAKLHSISEETKEILASLNDRVTIQYWVSEDVPTGFHNIRRDTVDYLEEFARYSDGTIKVEVLDPDSVIDEEAARIEEEEKSGEPKEKPPLNPFAQFDPSNLPPKDRAKYEFSETYGIPEIRGRSLEQDKVEVVFFFTGIRITYKDREPEIIPVHDSLAGLEYELASRLVKLTIEDKPTLAFFHGRPADSMEMPAQGPMPGMPPRKMHPYQPLLEAEFISAVFDVRSVELTEDSPIPDDSDLLVVAQPDALSERQLYEIERFIAAGGPTIFLVSRFSGDIDEFTIDQLSPTVDRLFKTWGVQLGTRLLSSTDCGVITQMVNRGGFRIRQPQGFPLAPAASTQGIDQLSPLTRGVERIVFAFATPLNLDAKAVEEAGLDLTVLASTSEHTWENNYSPQPTRGMFQPDSTTLQAVYDVAYFLEGTFPLTFAPGQPLPAFENGEAAAEPAGDGSDASPEDAGSKDDEVEPIPELERKPGRVVIASSSDMVKVQQLQENPESMRFFMNCIETLSLGQDLVNIRAKGQKSRLLEESEPWQRDLAKWGNVLGIPAIVLLLGAFRYMIRRTAAYAYEENYLKSHESSGGDV